MVEWDYQPTDDFGQAPFERLKNFPRSPDMWVYGVRLLANVAIRAAMRVYHRLEISGRENLPVSSSFVLVANHASHLDAVALLAALPLRAIHRAFPAAASDYFFTNLPKVVFSAIVINAMPFDRKENPRRSIELCRQLLETPGHVLILFPEGTRSPDGAMREFKPGIGFLVAGTNVPVVPCYLEGASRAWPKGKWIPRPRKLRLRIGTPINFAGSGHSKEEALAIAARLREAVAALSS
ncbi:MAG: lysophospholipid acyltransferase family protein [Thermoanaerobaculia bacterium]